MKFPRQINSNPAEWFPIYEAAPFTQNQLRAASFREQPLRASSEAHMLHPQCGHDTALAWRDYLICGENEWRGWRCFPAPWTKGGTLRQTSLSRPDLIRKKD